ncbi:MAG: prolyl oligopeptidase family serine peptidase [Acetobacter sp.]|uniref:S9 family peptidase n=1 Tax=Acetobacter sp. TaxID=440 RepID=UPI003F903329
MRHFPLTLLLLAGAISGFSSAVAAPLAETQSQRQIKAMLSLPFATNLVGARHSERFAWVERRAGVRNIFTSDAGAGPRALTHYTKDDGTDLWGLALSPDGKTVAYVEGGDAEYPDDPSPNPDLAVAGTQQTVHVVLENGKQMVLGEGWNPVFSPDGKTLAFSQKGTLFLAPVGGEAKAVMATRGSLTALLWSPDGKTLAFTLDRGSHAFIGLWHTQQSAMEFLSPALAQDSLPSFSPDGQRIAFVREHAPVTRGKSAKASFWSLHVYDLQSREDHSVWAPHAGAGARFFAPEGAGVLWSDNVHILFPWEGSGWMRVCRVDSQQPTSPLCLTPDKAEVSSYRLSDDGKTLFYTSNVGNLDEWHAWKVALDRPEPQRLTQSNEMETDVVLAGRAVGLMSAGERETTHPVILAPGKKEPIVLNAEVSTEIPFVSPQTLILKSKDGMDVHAQLFMPQTHTTALHPALVFVHGGPHRQMLPAFNSMGYYSNAYGMNQILAAQGYIVVSVNYRSGTGYGEAFRNAAGIGREGASEYQDVLAAATYLKTRPDVDPARIGIWGGSWGGYLTALALARNSDVFRAGADFHGVHDMQQSDKPGLSPEQNKAMHDLEWQSSPAANVAQWRSPVLLVHGDDDYNVEFTESTLLARLLSEQGVPYEEHAFPNERHAFLRMQDWLMAYTWMNQFFGKTLATSSH